MKAWLEKSRVWDYNDICNILPDLTSRRHFVKHLKEMGGIVLNVPTEEAANPLRESSTTSTVTLRVPQMSSSQTEAHGFQTETELRDSSTNRSSEHADQTDPAWLTPHQRSSNPRRHRGQRKKSWRK
ncbi:hypothetical protein ILYODFUR_024553 [Ilyodon furcidens]|uniref:Uncharacterized protein n=1 Tax=Ilyodon furcidens TaxID=33524 RepID=A0ABV0V6G9_9TELE